MNLKTEKSRLKQLIAARLKKIREQLALTYDRIADLVGIEEPHLIDHEFGEAYPTPLTMRKIGDTLDISLDWLICGKGPMFYKEKQKEYKPPPLVPEDFNPGEMEKQMKLEHHELLAYMERIPLLHHEVMVLFHRFQLEHPDLVKKMKKDYIKDNSVKEGSQTDG